jgi:hypothetical protein
VDWISPDRDRPKCLDFVNMEVRLWVSQNVGKFSASADSQEELCSVELVTSDLVWLIWPKVIRGDDNFRHRHSRLYLCHFHGLIH